MVAPEHEPLEDQVEVDGFFLGGLEGGPQRRPPARQQVGVAVEVRGAGSGRLRLQVLQDASSASLGAFAQATTARARSCTPTTGRYNGLGTLGYEHRPRSERARRPSDARATTTSISPPPRARGLDGEDDQQAEEVAMALERLGRRREHRGRVLGWTSDPVVPVGQVGEEALRAALHDGEQDSVLRAVVVVDRALEMPASSTTRASIAMAHSSRPVKARGSTSSTPFPHQPSPVRGVYPEKPNP